MIASVYRPVGDGTLDRLLLCTGLYVVNGDWYLRRNPLTEDITAPHAPDVVFELVGRIEAGEGPIDYNAVLARFQRGERAILVGLCPTCNEGGQWVTTRLAAALDDVQAILDR